MRKTCKACGARAWHGDLCNLHALERLRSNPRPTAANRLEQGRRLLREKAKELGIELAEEPAVALVGAGRSPRKLRSPVA
jgi:hypothetical protein